MSKIKMAIAAAILGIVGIAILEPSSASALSATYKDFSQLRALSRDYIPSRVYYTSNTKVYVKKQDDSAYSTTPITLNDIINATPGGDVSSDGNYKFKLSDTGKAISLKVTGSTATDKDGNPVDVVFTVRDLNKWAEGASLYLEIDRNACAATTGDSIDCSVVEVGAPFIIWVGSVHADGYFFVNYYKAGTSTRANIDKISYIAWDFDVLPDSSDPYDYSGKLFDGREGIAPTTGSHTYYLDGGVDHELAGGANGIFVDGPLHGHTSGQHGLLVNNSTQALVTGISSGQYGYRYSAKGAGIAMIFGSMTDYDQKAPKKYVVESGQTENRATTGDEFYYILEQEFPKSPNGSFANRNKMYQSLLNAYVSLKLYSQTRPSGYYVEDTFDKNIALNTKSESLTVTVGGTNYNVAVGYNEATHKLSLDFPDTILENDGLYDHTLMLKIPVKVEKTVNKNKADNIANSYLRYQVDGSVSTVKRETNKVTTTFYHQLTVRHINKDNGTEIVPTEVTEHDHGFEYGTTKLDELPEGLQLIEVPENATGILNKNITVTYYYSKVENPKTIDVNMIPFIGAFVGAVGAGGVIFFAVSKRR